MPSRVLQLGGGPCRTGLHNTPVETAGQSCPGAGVAPCACWGPHTAAPQHLCGPLQHAASCDLQLQTCIYSHAHHTQHSIQVQTRRVNSLRCKKHRGMHAHGICVRLEHCRKCCRSSAYCASCFGVRMLQKVHDNRLVLCPCNRTCRSLDDSSITCTCPTIRTRRQP